MVVQHNLTAMNANRYLGINNSKLSKSLEKLSSGYAINRAGDNAAGLAVSEKMRSQIAGMTQAVKNAQDGISMVQTFEGALTETDSILQRMKTLADQMANGSYDDPVDRTAAQQEFLQLNDELDQIADTDFNGVVVLNGGRMSDGTQAVGVETTTNDRGVITRTLNKDVNGAGLIDYANKAEQLAAEKAAKKAELEATKKELEAATFTDIKSSDKFTSVGENLYQSAEAKDLWGSAKGLDLKNDDAYVDVTYTVKMGTDGKPTYEITSAKSANGVDVTAAAKEKLTVAPKNGDATKTGMGGFDVTFDSKTISNPVFDATELKKGDVITLRYKGPGESAKAPTQIQIADDSLKFTGDVDADETHYKVAIGALTDAQMTADVKKGLDGLNGKEITFTVAASAKAPADLDAITLTGATFDNANNKVTIDGVDFHAAIASNKLTISTIKANGQADVKLFEIDFSAATNAPANGGTVKMTLAMDKYSVPDAAAGPDVEAIATDLGAANAENAAKIKDIEAQIKALDEEGVSVSDAFNKSEAKMTYKDSITLQVGARTKDAVNFTFNYNSNAIGDLTPDLDCSASGLGTNLLNLNTQEDANYAIDKIDQAINKVSLVRGTFGAIQNRLEHKIDNLNVSVENLTSAESQIRDTNMPQEMMNFTKQQILAQASQSMLAQANQLPQSVLSLLQ